MLPESLLYLCNFDEKAIDSKNEIIVKLWNNAWAVEDIELLKSLLSSGLDTETIVTELKNLKNNGVENEKVLFLATSIFLTFCDQNWNPHPEPFDLKSYLGVEWPQEIDVNTIMQKDSEPLYVNILYPELLYLSSQIFGALCTVEQNLIHLWWHFRSKVIHQRALEDTSASLYAELELLIAKLSNELVNLNDNPRLQILLSIEISQAFIVYGRVQGADEYLCRARNTAGLKLELTGVLGKRTKFQQNVLPQLALSSELESSINRPSAEDSHGASELPPEIELNDDVRLNKVEYSEKISQAELPSLEQILCLLTVQFLQKSQARDELMKEEIQPYIEAVLAQKRGAWGTRVAALLIRCRMEANHKRTVERAMLQCEAIVNDKSGASATTRLSYLWACGLPPAWSWRQQLADLYLSLGLVKAALEVYLRLQLWEDVIVCYTMLQLRHKAAEIIQQQIDINPTVKLYCLLGDATDDVKCYEKAWEFSGFKSSRAQRHWGNHLFERKKYEDCIPHFEKSVEINSIQEGVWLRLGYAALVCSQWTQAAGAYRRYTWLQPSSFEAWNNLAKVYLNLGQKARAHAALTEALRYNYDNWKLWENVIMVSVQTGHWEDVVRGCHRLLDLGHKYGDEEVLGLLLRAVLEDAPLAGGGGAACLQKRVCELFGRITSVQQNSAEVWRLYSAVSPTRLLAAQRLLKAYRGYTQTGSWSSSPETCKKVVELATSLLELSLEARRQAEDKDVLQANSQLSSARLTGQAVLRAAQKQAWPACAPLLPRLDELYNEITEYIKTIMYFVVLLHAFHSHKKYPKKITHCMHCAVCLVILSCLVYLFQSNTAALSLLILLKLIERKPGINHDK